VVLFIVSRCGDGDDFTHIFTENASYVFDFASDDYPQIINLLEVSTLEAEVTRIGSGTSIHIPDEEKKSEQNNVGDIAVKAPPPPAPILPTDIQITAEITSSGQTVTVNKYFANAYSVDW
jgi:hypothetical protein